MWQFESAVPVCENNFVLSLDKKVEYGIMFLGTVLRVDNHELLM